MARSMRRVGFLSVPVLLGLAACGNGSSSPVPRAKAPTETGGPTKCKVAASHSNPLVTEWAASEKANLEARLREGPVVVSYSGCSLQMLPQCRPSKGKYVWKKTTLATDVLDIRTEDDLFAKLPLGAVSLEAQLRDSGRLAVVTTVTGQMSLEGLGIGEVPTDGTCEGATHLVANVAVGAFKLKAGGALSAGGSVGGPLAKGGGHTESSEMLVKEAGDPTKCAESTSAAPSEACSTPVQLFMWPLPKRQAAATPPPGTPVPVLGPGIVAQHADAPDPSAIRATFETDRGDKHYVVKVDGAVACTTPCVRNVRPNSYIEFSLAGSLYNHGFTLTGYRAGEAVKITPGDRSGAWGGGLALTTTGGLATYVGGVLWLVGGLSASSKRSSGDVDGAERADKLANAGKYTLVAGVVMLVPGIILLAPGRTTLETVRDDGSARLGPGYVTGRTTRDGRFVLTPFGATGTF